MVALLWLCPEVMDGSYVVQKTVTSVLNDVLS